MAHTDSYLLHLIGQQNAEAFEIFLARHRTAVCRHVQRMVRNADAADDMAQEVFLRVWLRADQWDGRGSCTGWLLRIATNLALNHLRTQRRRRELPLESPSHPHVGSDYEGDPTWADDAMTLGPETLCLQQEQLQVLQTLIDALPIEKREVIRLVHEAEMELREIAEHLGVPEGTVKSRLYYARKALQHEWRDLGMEDE